MTFFNRFHNGDFMQHNDWSHQWTLESGYDKEAVTDTFPRRAMAAGQKACFSLLMTLYEQDLDYICRGPVQGFKVITFPFYLSTYNDYKLNLEFLDSHT